MLRKFLGFFVVLAALFLVSLQPAAAQQRIALVIGNAAYPKGPLATSLADGGLVAEALTSIGFQIVEGADVNQGDLRKVFRDFLEKVQAAGPDTIAFIYYSGYALQFEGDNYLIPVDARLERDSDIPIEGLRLFDLLRPLADTPATTKIVVLDATRPLPFQIQGGQLAHGLGAIESAPGMLVAFSSAPGMTAQDGPGPYGPYATAIAEMVREPGLDIDTLFARIRVRTNETTNGVQTPWDVSQLKQVVMLVPGAPSGPPPGAPQGLLTAPQGVVGAPTVRRAPRPIRDIGPEEAYAAAIEQDDLPTYVEYVRAYPNSPYAQRIWATIRARREALLWRRALLQNSPDGYWTYLERYPDGMYTFDARRRLRRLSAGDRPPPGFRMMDYDDVPPPIAGEPARMFDVYPSAPPPRRYLAPPPAFIVGLPPPRRDGGGLWRHQQGAFPVIVTPPGGQRPGFGPGGPQGRPGQPGQKGPAVVTTPPGPPPGGPPPGFKGPPKEWQKPGSGIGNAPPGPPAVKGPAVVTTPPGGPPPGFKGPPKDWQKPGSGIGSAPPGPPAVKGPAVVTTPPGPPPGGPPPGFKGPPKDWQKPGSGIGNAPPGPPAVKGPAVVTTPPGPPAGGPPPGFKGPPKEWQKPGSGIGNAPPGVKGPPPQMQMKQVAPPQPPRVAAPPPPKAPAPPPPPPPPQVKGPPPGPPPLVQKGPPPQAVQKGPPPGAKGLPKCAAVQGKQPCTP